MTWPFTKNAPFHNKDMPSRFLCLDPLLQWPFHKKNHLFISSAIEPSMKQCLYFHNRPFIFIYTDTHVCVTTTRHRVLWRVDVLPNTQHCTSRYKTNPMASRKQDATIHNLKEMLYSRACGWALKMWCTEGSISVVLTLYYPSVYWIRLNCLFSLSSQNFGFICRSFFFDSFIFIYFCLHSFITGI